MPDAESARERRVEPIVLVAGSSMTDMISYAAVLPGPGETVIGETFAVGHGGKGANQAVMCSLLGASVRFVGSVGNDAFGTTALENLQRFGIDTSAVSISDAKPSGVAPIWVDGSGENRIIVVPGANAELDPARVARVVAEVKPDVVLTQFEVPEACTLAALEAARAHGGIALLNPAPMQAVSSELLRAASWLIPNSSEFEAIERLLGLEAQGDLEERAARCASTLETELVVTLGADGALLVSRSEVKAIPAPAAKAVDTTGAGDAFVGAFAYALACGADAVAAVTFACMCATTSVEARGTQTSFPRGKELDEPKRVLSSHGESRR